VKNGAESGKRHFDMIVVGGGMSGAATAYYLAKGGMRVALIEKRSICSGASGRNGGQVIQVEGRDELTKDVITKKNSIASHGKKLLDTLNDELGVDIEYRKTGGLDLAYSDEDERVITMVTKWQHEVGDTSVEYLGASGFRDICRCSGKACAAGSTAPTTETRIPSRSPTGICSGRFVTAPRCSPTRP